MISMPKVSIIIPTYNVEKYLRECLDSVINQTLKDIEIICVDDGSTDNSGKILDEYANNDSRIKVIHKENGGYGKAMNTGFSHATGEYIGIVEPDDYIQLNMYETLYNVANEHNVDFVKADFYRFIGDGEEREFMYNHLDETGKYYNKVINIQEDLTPFNFIMNTWSGIYSREFLQKYNIFHNETPGASFQDNGFWFQTFCRSNRCYFVNKPFYMNRRDNPNSSVKNKEKVYCMKEEYDHIRRLLEADSYLKTKFLKIYQYKRFFNYKFNWERIHHKYKKEWLMHFSSEYKIAFDKGEVDESLFEPVLLEELKFITYNPKKYYKNYCFKTFFQEYIFSLRNNKYKTHKIIKILGMTFKIKRTKNGNK